MEAITLVSTCCLDECPLRTDPKCFEVVEGVKPLQAVKYCAKSYEYSTERNGFAIPMLYRFQKPSENSVRVI